MLIVENKTYRYPGVKPFSTEEKDWFFGREQDSEDLYRLLLVKQMVVLYGKSGFGKSSLVNAGLIPKLATQQNWTCIPIRFKNFSKEDIHLLNPLENSKRRIEGNLTEVSERFKESLLHLANGENSLWWYVKLRQFENPKEQLLLIFDQFEELFSYPEEQIEQFASELADVLYTSIPVRYRATLEQMLENGELDEEMHAFLYEKPKIKILFSIRADRLSLLNGLTRFHSGILQNCFELQPLSEAQARQAIVMPALLEDERFVSPIFSYEEAALVEMLKKIMQDSKVEVTSVLQILCRYLEEKKVLGSGIKRIGLSDLGEVGDIIKEYYEDILLKIDDVMERDKARDLIETKLVAGNVRNSLPEAFILSQSQIKKETLAILEETSLLRKERDVQGRLIYEVSHDTLVEPILQMAKVRLEEAEWLRNKELELSISAEQERVRSLERLNKRVNAQITKARAISALALLISALAIYLYVKASQESDRAIEAEKIAEQERLKATKALEASEKSLSLLRFQKAKELMDKGKLFLDYEEPKLALKAFAQAKYALLDDSPSNSAESGSYEITKPFNVVFDTRTDSLWKEIESYILKCK